MHFVLNSFIILRLTNRFSRLFRFVLCRGYLVGCLLRFTFIHGNGINNFRRYGTHWLRRSGQSGCRL